MKKQLTYLYSIALLFLTTACEDVNYGNLFYSPCDVNARFEQSIVYNQERQTDTLTVSDDAYSFWVTSDLHLKTELTTPIANFLKSANDGAAQFIVYNGDIFHGKEEYADFASDILHSQSPLPSFYVAGNHDLYFGWDVYHKRFGSSTYTAVVKTPKGNDLLIFLESASATLGQSQYNWLKEVFNQRYNYRHCFVFTHTNFYNQHITNGVFLSDEAHVLYHLFKEKKVTAVYSGHSHVEDQEIILGVTYLTTGNLQNGKVARVTVTDQTIEHEFKQF